MFEIFLMFVVFILVVILIDSAGLGIIAAIIAGILTGGGCELKANLTQTPTEDVVQVDESSTNYRLTIPDGRITDKLRNSEEVNVFPVVNTNTYRVCHASADCFTTDDLRRHDGVLYACNPDTIHCYKVKEND